MSGPLSPSSLSGVRPEIHVLGISLKSFGIVFASGFIAAGMILVRRLRELAKPVDWAYEMAFAAMLGGLVGARVYYLIENYSQVKHDLIGSLFSGSGLVWYGGVIGGALAVLGWARWRGILNLALLDLACVPLALGYAIGRIGCQVSGDGDYGAWCYRGSTPVTCPGSKLSWSMSYPHGTVQTPPGVRVQPTPIYETVAMGLVAWWLWRMRDRYRPGVLFAFYLVLGGLERLLIEFLRRNHRIVVGLTAPQLESIALMVIGAVWLAVLGQRGGLRPASANPAPAFA
ncbi:MAG TPA: prolipoprotein diacylglyceryl transferase family protein [Solirubrobacteraceae bacterium]|nr:prolipoprotein diacylglyceryl transferase family protein [Solirubrobacteraceae bacterium]